MYPEIAKSAHMKELQKLLHQKPYLKYLEIRKYYDDINNNYKKVIADDNSRTNLQ